MTIKLANSHVAFVPLEMSLSEFPKYLELGLSEDSDTLEVETLGSELVGSDFDHQRTEEFIKRVCDWGGYAGIAGKVLRRNPLREIAETFREAYALTQADALRPALVKALSINCLGVSFASKHLKFLDPTRHVVLDSIISSRLGYLRDDDGLGYEAFVADCAAILGMLKSAKVSYPMQDRSGWRIADVEMAIFQKLRQG